MSRICLYCEKELTSRFQKKFCNNSCSASFNNTKRKPNQTKNKKISKTLKRKIKLGLISKPIPPKSEKHGKYTIKERECEICNDIFIDVYRKTCSKLCQHILHQEWLRKNRSHIIGRTDRSYMEKSFEEWLNNHGINKGLSGYINEIHFKNPKTNKHGWLDFIFPKRRLIIELDGSHHKKRKKLDQQRDEYLKSRGWDIFRVSQKDYQKGTHIKTIRSLLDII